jgi:hypothetical protein
MYINTHSSEQQLRSDNLIFQPRDSFYFRALDPEWIRKHISVKARRRMEDRYASALAIDPERLHTDPAYHHVFVDICRQGGLTAVADIIEAIDLLADADARYYSLMGLGSLTRLFARAENRDFYKRMKKVFRHDRPSFQD